MPTMIRQIGKTKKLAYAILGKPANMYKRTKKEQYIARRLLYEETDRSR